MYSRIIVPLDGSKLSESILPYARALVKAFNVPVELLQAVDPEIVPVFVSSSQGRYPHIIAADLKQKVIEYLEPVAGSFPHPEAVSCAAAVGKPEEVITETAAADRTALIAMATHGRSGIQRWLLGSIANKVLLTTANPLLLVGPGEKLENTGVASLKKIIVPLDGSGLAESVLPHVATLAKKFATEIVLVQTYSLQGVADHCLDGHVPDWDQLARLMREDGQRYLDEIAQRLAAEGLPRISTLVLQGEAAEDIIKLARKTQDSLVAMCTHGRSGVGRWVLGSITDRVVRHSGDAVLVVRAQTKRE